MNLNDELIEKMFSIPLFRNYTSDMRNEALAKLQYGLYEYPKGEIIIRQGETCRYVHILLQGKLNVDVLDLSGNEIRVETIRAPRTFGTPHVFSEKNVFPATFTVVEDLILMRVTSESFFALMSNTPLLLRNFLCVSANCNKCTMARLRVLTYRSIRTRFISYLFDRLTEASNTVKLEHNQEQLAEYLGVTRPALAKEIRKLIDEGYIRFNCRDEVIIIRRQALLQML
ncbi:MAG: Crp/Fnr family transcriptional regulator [Prevotellaceae bacterium]|jgi:CRP-like cAMP-binding protein|nr:Crp/Fnr family transcriptional regulator [Prevotellaceae bacterium]